MTGVAFDELVWLALAVMAAGVVTGLLAGLFGIGGGAVIVPVLFEVFRLLGVPEEVGMQLCVGTSLAIIVPTTVRSYRAHRAKGLVIQAVMRSWAVPAVIGVAAGSVTAAFAPAQVFKLAFVVIAGVIAAKLLAGLPHQALLPPLSIGFVSVIGVVMIAPISSWIAPLGARLAHALPRRRLEIGFGLFLIAASLRFVVSLVWP